MLLAEKYAVADMNAIRSYERNEGEEHRAKKVYDNCIARNMSPEDAMAISGWDDKQKKLI